MDDRRRWCPPADMLLPVKAHRELKVAGSMPLSVDFMNHPTHSPAADAQASMRASEGASAGDLPLRVVRLSPSATCPQRAESGAAGYDLYACGEQKGRMIATGVALEIPTGWVGLIRDRSGIAASGRGFTVAGVIDSSYRGEVKILFDRDMRVADGERIAQMVIVPHFSGGVEEVTQPTELSASARGESGFGSTGQF